MDNALAQLDWSLIQVFVAVADEGSLSAAARRLGASQPTVGRQVRALEDATGVAMFERVPRGLRLTEAGAALLEPARAMAEAARQLGLAAAGRDAGLSGTVRLTASVIVSHHLLPPILARLRAKAPEIAVELVPSDRAENLLFRQADIALRMFRPDQLDIVARHLGELPLGLYAARAYLDRHGRPAAPGEVFERDLVGYDRDDRLIRGMRALGWPAQREWFATRCDDQAAHWQLVRAGCGIGVGPRAIGSADPMLEEIVLPGVTLPALPVWLSAHERLRRVPRIARLWDALADGLRPALERRPA